jgi:hypothetical protein
MTDILYQTVCLHRIFLFETATAGQTVLIPPQSIEMRNHLYEELSSITSQSDGSTRSLSLVLQSASMLLQESSGKATS